MSGVGQRRRNAINTLSRRKLHLAERLVTYRGDPSWTKAELSGVTYALAIIDAAYQSGALDDLERLCGLRNEVLEEV